MKMEEILAVIRAERIRQGLTFEAAAAPIGMARTNWQRVESGARPASESLLQQMAERLGLEIEFSATVKKDGRRIGKDVVAAALDAAN